MTEGQSFLLLLAVLYLEEASYWLPHGVVLARTSEGKGGGAAKGWTNTRGVLAWLPFFVAGHRSPVAFWPFSLSGDGISAMVVPSPNPGWAIAMRKKIYRWGEVKSVAADGKKILINQELFARCVSGAVACELVQFLKEIKGSDVLEREAIISQAVERSVDSVAAVEAVGRVWAVGKVCRKLSALIFPTLFLVIPAAYIFLGSGGVTYSLIGCLWVVMALVAVTFFRAHARLTPGLSGERWQHVMIALVSAPHAARLPDVLSRNALGMAWPLAVAEVGTVSGDALRRDLMYPIFNNRDVIAEAFYDKYLRPFGMPGRLPDSEYGCSRCLGSYTRAGSCSDCGGLPLVEVVR